MVSVPAIIVGVTLLAVYVLVIVSLAMSKAAWWMLLIQSILALLMVALVVYDTNCLTSGNCVVWSWIRSLWMALGNVLFIIISIMFMVKTKNLVK